MSNSETELKLRILADAKQFISELDLSKKSFIDLQSTVFKFNETLGKLEDAINNEQAALKKGDTAAAESARAIIKAQGDILKATEDSIVKQVAAIEKKEQVAKKAAQKEADDVIKDTKRQTDEVLKAKEQQTKAAQDAAEKQAKAARETAAAEELKNQRIIQGIKEVSQAFNSIISSIAGTANPIEAFKSGLEGIGRLAGPEGEFVAGLINGAISAGEALFEVTKRANEAQKQLDLLSTTTGLKPETIATLRVGAESIGAGFLQVVSAVDRVAEGIESASPRFVKGIKVLGLSIEDLKTKGPDQALRDIITRFRELPPGSEKAAAGFEIFGLRAGKIISAIAPQFEQLEASVKRSGLVLDNEGAEGLRKFNSAIIDVNNQIEGLRNLLGAELGPTFTQLAKDAKTAIDALRSDPEVVAGFKAIIIIVEKLISVIGQLGIGVIKDLITDIGTLANVFRLLDPAISKNHDDLILFNADLVVITTLIRVALNPLGSLVTAFRELTTSTEEKRKKDIEAEKASSSHSDTLARFGTVASKTVGEVENLKDSLKNLAKENKNTADLTRADSTAAISLIREQVSVGIKDKKSGAEEIAIIQRNQAAVEIGLLTEVLNKAREAAKENKALKEDVIAAEIALARASAKAQIEEAKLVKESQKIALEEITQATEIEKNKRIAANAQSIEAINIQEQKGVLNHAQASQAKAKITETEIQNEIAAAERKVANDKIGLEEQKKAAIEVSKLKGDLAKLEEKNQLDLNKAILDDAKALSAQLKILLDKRVAEEKSAIESITAKFTAAGVSRVDIERAVLQEKEKTAELERSFAAREFENAKQRNTIAGVLNEKAAELLPFRAKLTAADEKVLDLQRQIRDVASQTVDAFSAEAAALEKVSDRASSTTAKIEDIARKTPLIVGESVKIVDLSIEQLEKRIADIVNGTGIISADLERVLGALQNELTTRRNAASQAAAAAQAKIDADAAAERIRIAQEGASKLIDIERTIAEDKAKAAAESLKVTNKFNEDVTKENDSFRTSEEKATENFNAQQAAETERAQKEELDRLRSFEEQKENINRAANTKRNADQRSSVVDEAKLQDELSKVDKTKDPKKFAELTQQLADLKKKDAERDSREARKNAELLAAENQAKTAEELKILQDAIEEKFRLEEESTSQLAEVEKTGNAEAIARLKALIAEQEANNKAAADKALARLIETEAAKAKIAADARQKQLDDYNQQRADANAAHDKRLTDLATQAIADQKAIKDNLAIQVQTAKDAAAAIAASFGLSQAAFEALVNSIAKGSLTIQQALAALAGGSVPTGAGAAPPPGVGTPPAPGGNILGGPTTTPPAPGVGSIGGGGVTPGGTPGNTFSRSPRPGASAPGAQGGPPGQPAEAIAAGGGQPENEVENAAGAAIKSKILSLYQGQFGNNKKAFKYVANLFANGKIDADTNTRLEAAIAGAKDKKDLDAQLSVILGLPAITPPGPPRPPAPPPKPQGEPGRQGAPKPATPAPSPITPPSSTRNIGGVTKGGGTTKSAANISRGDTEISPEAQAEADASAALRGSFGANGANGVSASQQTKNVTNNNSMTQTNSITISVANGDPATIKKVVMEVLAEVDSRARAQLGGFGDRS